MPDQKILYILRHAKAEAGASYQDDHMRPLNERGLSAADVMGKYLARHGIMPDLVLCSTSERTCQTWDIVQQAYKKPPPVEYSERLYHASAAEMLKLLSETQEKVGKLMLVGHNPGLHQFCLKLAKAGDEKLLDTMTEKFPTCAFAAIALGATAWRNAGNVRGELQAFVTPQMLMQTADSD